MSSTYDLLLRALALAVLLVLGATSAGAQAQRPALAPDGRPGLGQERTARELERLLRSPTEAERELLAELYGLVGEVHLLRASLVPHYGRLGYTQLGGGPRELGLDELHAAYAERTRELLPGLAGGGEQAQLLARLHCDLRFRLRALVLEHYEQETVELRGGLRLLRAMTDGTPELSDYEARELAWRVDLAAAGLRVMRMDLEALRETGERRVVGRPDPAWVAELLGIGALPAGVERDGALRSLERRLDKQLGRMRALLFSDELAEELQLCRDRRAAAREQALGILKEVRKLAPGSADEDPALTQALSTSERHAYTRRLAVEGLTHDPLNEELCWHAGVSSDFAGGAPQSKGWFDRFLALRGIRAGDERSWRARGRPLDSRELHALNVVQGALLIR